VAQLAQAYIHLKPYHASRKKLQRLGKSTDILAADIAKRIYGGNVVIDVQFEEGSLRVRVTVIGTLAATLAVYSTVADYKGFKDSVAELCDDARQYATDVCEPFTKKAGANEEQVYRFERRTKTTGKLYRLAKRLEKLENSVSALSPNDVKKELSQASRELAAIAKDLSPTEMEAVEKQLTSKTLPPPSKWPPPQLEPPKAAKKDEEQLVLDKGLGLMLPAPSPPSPNHLVVYHNQTRVEAQLPGIRDNSIQQVPTLSFDKSHND
jgi:hypothetical protein